MSNKDIKLIAKVGFALGCGLQVGKYAGSCINGVFDGLMCSVLVILANKGNPRAQHFCETNNIYYEKKDISNQ